MRVVMSRYRCFAGFLRRLAALVCASTRRHLPYFPIHTPHPSRHLATPPSQALADLHHLAAAHPPQHDDMLDRVFEQVDGGGMGAWAGAVACGWRTWRGGAAAAADYRAGAAMAG